MSQAVQCHVIRITPRGRGAVASLLLVGQDARVILEPYLVFPKSGQISVLYDYCEKNAPVFAHFLLKYSHEEVVLDFRRPDMVELHCHGGDMVVNAIESVLIELGAVSQTWQDWLLNAQEPGVVHYETLDVIQREAWQLLPLAETELTAKLLLSQCHGTLSRRINHLHNLLDDVIQGVASDGTVREAMGILDSLLATYTLGRHLTVPFHVGLIGPVNVGKSSLMNALVGFNRSITSQIAGTTRDAVSVNTVITGWPVVLTDTAGIRKTTNSIEQEGISRIPAMIAKSDLLLFVTDVCDRQAFHHQQFIDVPLTMPVIHVVNKIDLVEEQNVQYFLDWPESVSVSALTGSGLDQLNKAIIQKIYKSCDLVNDEANLSQTALVFTKRQYSQLLSVKEMLESHR